MPFLFPTPASSDRVMLYIRFKATRVPGTDSTQYIETTNKNYLSLPAAKESDTMYPFFSTKWIHCIRPSYIRLAHLIVRKARPSL
jgi:hypothetical protein